MIKGALEESAIEKVITTNTAPLATHVGVEIEVVSIDSLLAKALSSMSGLKD